MSIRRVVALVFMLDGWAAMPTGHMPSELRILATLVAAFCFLAALATLTRKAPHPLARKANHE